MNSETIYQKDIVADNGVKHHFELQDLSFEVDGYTEAALRVIHDWGEMENGEVCSTCFGRRSWEFPDFASAHDLYFHLLRDFGAASEEAGRQLVV